MIIQCSPDPDPIDPRRRVGIPDADVALPPRHGRRTVHSPFADGVADVIGLDALLRRLEPLRDAYASAAPFPHVVLDDVLPAGLFRTAVTEFPAMDDASWSSYLHVNETKFANPRREQWAPGLRAIAECLAREEFVTALSDLTGFGHLVPDLSMDGGGLHQTLRGGRLNIHADFTTHHRMHGWRRRVNLLLYLNETWPAEWGGALELWDSEVRECVRRVEPLPNRMLIFTTSEDAFHGHPDPLRCPADVARRSLAMYYFTEEVRPPRRPTRYRARPGDGPWRSATIWADRLALGVYDAAKSRLSLSDQFASRTLSRVHRLLGRASSLWKRPGPG